MSEVVKSEIILNYQLKECHVQKKNITWKGKNKNLFWRSGKFLREHDLGNEQEIYENER